MCEHDFSKMIGLFNNGSEYIICTCKNFHGYLKLSNVLERGFGLVWFDVISNIVGYLMLNLIYTYILDIYGLETLVNIVK